MATNNQLLNTFNELIWNNRNPSFYDTTSPFYKILTLVDITECITLYDHCPLIVHSAAINLVNQDTDKSTFNKFHSTQFNLKDISITYKSNNIIKLIDCQPWSIAERRLITDCLHQLYRLQTYPPKNTYL